MDFGAAAATVRQAATVWAALPPTGTVTVQYGDVSFRGTDPVRNVFRVASDVLAHANTIDLAVPPDATVLVDVTGAIVSVANAGFRLGGVAPAHLLYNFAQATTVTLRDVAVPGSVLAPQATAALPNSAITGTLIAKTLDGMGQAAPAPFTGCLPNAPAPAP